MAGPILLKLHGELICVRPSHHLPVHGDPVALRDAAAERVAVWRKAQVPERRILPSWETEPRPAVKGEITGTALTLAKSGTERGWYVTARYGRGPYQSGSTERARVVVCDRVWINLAARAVSLGGNPARRVQAVGCWADGRTSGALWWAEGAFPQNVGIEALQLLISQAVVIRR